MNLFTTKIGLQKTFTKKTSLQTALVTDLNYDIATLNETGTPPPDYMILTCLREQLQPYDVGGISQTSAVFAEFDAKPPLIRHTTKLIDSLEAIATAHDARQQAKKKPEKVNLGRDGRGEDDDKGKGK